MLSWPYPSLNGISIGSAVFTQLTAEGPYTYFTMGSPSPLKFATSHVRYGPHLIHDSLGGPPEATTKRYLHRFSRLCGAHDRDRATDRPRYSLCNNRPHLRTIAMRPDNFQTGMIRITSYHQEPRVNDVSSCHLCSDPFECSLSNRSFSVFFSAFLCD